MRYFVLLLIITVTASLSLTGCGGGGSVTGIVTMDGQPLPEATVEFTPQEGGRPGTGKTDDGGNFELKYLVGNSNLPPGKYDVTIRTATTKIDDQGNEVDVPETVPAIYNNNSNLVREVIAGSNQFNIELESK